MTKTRQCRVCGEVASAHQLRCAACHALYDGRVVQALRDASRGLEADWSDERVLRLVQRAAREDGCDLERVRSIAQDLDLEAVGWQGAKRLRKLLDLEAILGGFEEDSVRIK